MSSLFLTSVARIADFEVAPYQVEALDRSKWQDGDYVYADVIGAPNRLYRAELINGRLVHVLPGDRLVGALGHRAATLEGVGSWREVENDGVMHALTGAGLIGKSTSMCTLFPECMRLSYRGHLMRNGEPLRMADFAISGPYQSLSVPIVLLVGTSMSSGKTTVGRLLVHELVSQGLKVVGAKLTGAARYRDVLSFRDAGASAVFDFVDAGLPSTVVPEVDFLQAIKPLVGHMASLESDVAVVEAGASPLEPYNGAALIKALGSQIQFTVLCASDPYAVVGVQQAFDLQPDLVSGPAANTSAGVELVQKLTGVNAVNVLATPMPELRAAMKRCLSLPERGKQK